MAEEEQSWTPTEEELQESLEPHKQWVQSEKKEGKRANLHEADLSHMNLQNANLWRANLQGAYLRGVNLQKARLRFANLQKVDLGFADLQEADLRNVDLQEALLLNADLLGADLSKANLQGAICYKSNLKEANLKKVKGWQEVRSLFLANVYEVKNAPQRFMEWAVAKGAVCIADLEEWIKLRDKVNLSEEELRAAQKDCFPDNDPG